MTIFPNDIEGPAAAEGSPQSARDNPTLAAALEYARHGLRVVRLGVRSKQPNIPDWPDTGATIDGEVIRRWFAEQPQANLGIVGGYGLAVLDVDMDKGGYESLCQLATECGECGLFPMTALAYTGSGGFHIYFRLPYGVAVGSPVGFRPGLDLRSTGGQVVAPPSVHPETGRPYQWIWHPREGIALMPRRLLEVLETAGHVNKHLATRREPKSRNRCNAKKAPGSLQERTTRPRGRIVADGRTDAPRATPGPFPRARGGATDINAVIDDMITRFPVPGVGHRHDLMVRAVGSLAGRRHPDETIRRVMMGWWEHYHRLGLTATDRDAMERELDDCLSSTRKNPDFGKAHLRPDREVACAEFVLPRAMLDLLDAPVAKLWAWAEGSEVTEQTSERKPDVTGGECYQGESNPPVTWGEYLPIPQYNTCNGGNTNGDSLIGVTRGFDGRNSSDPEADSPGNTQRRSLMGSLCETPDESLFVESLLAIYASRRQASGPGDWNLPLTHDQLRRVASGRSRRAMPVWENPQIDRLKRKFIRRLRDYGRHDPATRLELFREVSKGRRARGSDKGTPSVYEPTGIEVFFRTAAESRAPSEEWGRIL